MKVLSALAAITLSFVSISRAASESGEYISQLGYATTMAPVVTVLLPVAPTIFSFALTFSPDSIARKLVIDAQEDFAYFVVSEGAVRTSRLEQTIKYLRQFSEVNTLSDFEIAQSVLGVQ